MIFEAGLQTHRFVAGMVKLPALRRATCTKPPWKSSHDWGKTHLVVPQGMTEQGAQAATSKGSKRRRYAGKTRLPSLRSCQQTEANLFLPHGGLR